MAQGDVFSGPGESDAARQPETLSLVQNIINQLVGVSAGPKGGGSGNISAGAILGIAGAVTNLIVASQATHTPLSKKLEKAFNRKEIQYLLSLRNRGQVTGPLNLIPGAEGPRGFTGYSATEVAPPFPQPASGGGVYAPGTYLGQTGALQGGLLRSKRVKVSHLVTSGTEAILTGIANRLFAGVN